MWYCPNGDEGFFGFFFHLGGKKKRLAGEAIEEKLSFKKLSKEKVSPAKHFTLTCIPLTEA
jgi:hypothetical protein